MRCLAVALSQICYHDEKADPTTDEPWRDGIVNSKPKYVAGFESAAKLFYGSLDG